MRDDIVFVVLSYNVFQETIDCVESIKTKIDTDRYHIILVDNDSPDGSGVEFERKYYTDEKVLVKRLQENVGFARGNNEGINIAIQNYAPKFICCLNNDTVFLQENFFEVLNDTYTQYNSAVIAPKVFLLNEQVQAMMPNLGSIDYYQKELNKIKGEGIYAIIQVMKNFLKRFAFIRLLKNKITKQSSPLLQYENIVLHGCCLIFTPSFFTLLKGFNPKTFMFREEELLFLDLKRKGLSNLYCPELYIKHLEDISTNNTFISDDAKRKFLRDNQIKSLEILIDELKQDVNVEEKRMLAVNQEYIVKGTYDFEHFKVATVYLSINLIEAFMGSPNAILNIANFAVNSPVALRNTIFLSNFTRFLKDVNLVGNERQELIDILHADGKAVENTNRILLCIEKIETEKKIDFIVNATRALLDKGDKKLSVSDYFRICQVISNTLEEDLLFLKENILDGKTIRQNVSYDYAVQGLLSSGLMHQEAVALSDTHGLKFTPLGKLVDEYALSYDENGKYDGVDLSGLDVLPSMRLD